MECVQTSENSQLLFCCSVFFKSEMSLIIYVEVLRHFKSPVFHFFVILLLSFRTLLLLV